MAANTLGQKATEAYTAAAALANPFTRRIAEAIATATNNNKDAKTSGRGRGGGGNKSDSNCSSQDVPFGFLDNMCGPMLRNFNSDLGGDSGDVDDLTINERDERDRSSRGRSGRGRDRGRSGGRRRPTSSYDYDDETMATDITGSYDEDDDTYDDDRRKSSSRRGRDRKPRSPACDSPSEMSGAYSEFDDTTFGDAESSAYYETDNKKDTGKKKKNGEVDESATATTGGAEKLITQPLASGFAKRCYFTKAGIGRSTQHYEGLTLTGNTVLMLAAAMKLKGCPTICDEDLRRVEQTYPNQFSRLPDELLLSSGWRRISKYCHFSHKPLPDGVPFFHSRKRCHPNNGGFYFLLCSAVGMTRLMDVEPLNKDALAVLQTDFPLTCEKAPTFLMEEPNEWTLVNKFCFFSGGPINVEEDVYYRAELGGTAIYMLAFLSPSLSPEELYRLKQPSGEKSQQLEGQQQEDTGPLKSVAAVEEVESVYDLTERDFEDLKLYHLGPCRALPPYLLHPESWTKVLPPHFVAAREEALRIAQEYEGPIPAGSTNQAESAVQGSEGENPGSGYVELYPPPTGSGVGMVDQAGYPPQHEQYGMPPAQSEMNYYYAPPSGYPPSQYQQPMYGNPNMGAPSPDRSMGGPPQYNHNGPHQPYGNAQMVDPHWRDVQEEGAFGAHLPHDEAIATRAGIYGGGPVDGAGGLMHHHMGGPGQMDPIMMDPEGQYGNGQIDPPVDPSEHGDDANSMSGPTASSLMGGAQSRLREKRMNKTKDKAQRPDLSTKLGNKNMPSPLGEGTLGDESTWNTDGESSYGTSLVSGSSYTDTTNPNERNSRRALILQMAKARMKSSKEAEKKMGKGGNDTSLDAPQDELEDEVAGLELD